MTDTTGFVTPPPVERGQTERLAVVWAGRPGWTGHSLSLHGTKPVDSSVDLQIDDDRRNAVMPLTAGQARELAHELIIRADLIDPKEAARG